MTSTAARMSCPTCGYHWQAEALLAENGAYLIVDDLCPLCEAQGEPTDLVLPKRADGILDESLHAGPAAAE